MSEEAALEKKRYERLEDLDIGSAMTKKLREIGIGTVENLGMATYKELEKAGIGKKNAKQLISKARSCMTLQFIRGDELVKMRQTVRRCAMV